MTDLPLIGEPDTANALTTAIDRMRVMGVTARGNYVAVHPECINYYLYGNETGDGSPHVVPKIQGMINAAVAQAVRNIPNVCLKVSTEGDGGPQVLTTSGQAVTLDSSAVCDFYQHAVDTVLNRSDFKKFYRKMALYGKIFGWQDAIADENHAEHKLDLKTFPALQWYKPSDVEDIEDMSFFGLDIPVDAEWAKKKYPDLKEKIDTAAQRAVQLAPSAAGYSDIYMSQTWAYPIVTLGIFFIRNREIPMTAQDAIATGDFESREVEVPAGENDAIPPIGGNSAGDSVPSGPDSDEGGGLGDIQSPSVDLDAPTESEQPQAIAPTMREGIFHKKTNQEVSPGHELWPLQYAMSKSIQIVDQVVEDVVWDGVDFPILTNINIRVPMRPFGQSDCIRVRTQQNDINSVNSSIVKHAQWWKGPISLLPQSVQESLPPEFRNIGLQPNKTYWVPNDILKELVELFKGQNILGQYEPPTLPPHLMEIQNYLGAAFDVVGNRPDVSQGNSPTANSSGELAKVLLDASQQQNDFASLGLEDMTLRLGRLTLDYIVRTWTVEDFLRFNKTYDPQTVELIMALEKTMEWEMEVDGATAKQQRAAQVRADYTSVPPLIDQEAALEKLPEYDGPAIMQRMQMAAQQQAMAQAAVAGATGSDSTQLQSQPPGQQPAPTGSFKMAGAAA